jgi:hypothetical protein
MSFFVEQIRDEGGDFPFPRRTDRYRWPARASGVRHSLELSLTRSSKVITGKGR